MPYETRYRGTRVPPTVALVLETHQLDDEEGDDALLPPIKPEPEEEEYNESDDDDYDPDDSDDDYEKPASKRSRPSAARTPPTHAARNPPRPPTIKYEPPLEDEWAGDEDDVFDDLEGLDPDGADPLLHYVPEPTQGKKKVRGGVIRAVGTSVSSRWVSCVESVWCPVSGRPPPPPPRCCHYL
jgi:hypothetical protein